MFEILDNEDFRIERIDGNAISIDTNKLKLLATSYAVIMEVQDAYIEEELAALDSKKLILETAAKEEGLSKRDRAKANKKVKDVEREITILRDRYEEFSNARERFLLLAKKALKLPKENLEELVDGMTIKEDDDELSINEMMSAMDEAQASLQTSSGEDIFSKIDTDAIKQEVERTMNEKTVKTSYGPISFKDNVDNIVKEENFDKVVSDLAMDVKDKLDEKTNESNDSGDSSSGISVSNGEDETFKKVTPKDVTAIFDNMESDIFDSEIDDEVSTDSMFAPRLEIGNKPVVLDSKKIDVSDDEEIKELERQLAEIYKASEETNKILSIEKSRKNSLETELASKRKEADEKSKVALDLIDKAKEEERRRRKEELKRMFAEASEGLKSSRAEVDDLKKGNQAIEIEIGNLNQSIAESDKTIEEYGGGQYH